MKKLPAFNLSLIDGTILKSSSITNKTILFFYPKAMTSGCTVEVQEFQKEVLYVMFFLCFVTSTWSFKLNYFHLYD